MHKQPKGPRDYVALGAGPEDLARVIETAEYVPPPPSSAKAQKWTSRQLAEAQFPVSAWLVPGLLPEGGLVLLAGKPKVGKSWLALDIVTGLAAGREICARPVLRQAKTLYLALEDTPRRLKSRLRLGGFPQVDDCVIMTGTEGHRLDAEGRRWLKETICSEGFEVVVIDTLARLRPVGTKQTSQYEADYNLLSSVKTLADELGITVVAVHHLRKMPADDPLEEVSGTTGITGAADTVLILKRPRGESDGTLFVAGRDTEEQELAVSFENGRWRVLGDARAHALSEQRKRILEVVEETEGMTPKKIAEATGLPHESVRILVRKLAAEGYVESVERGRYRIPRVGINAINSVNPDSLVNPVNLAPLV